MKNIRNLIIGIVLILATISCGLFENGRIIGNTSVTSVKIESLKSSNLSIIAETTWKNGCGSFEYFLYYEKGKEIFFEVYCGQPEDAVCTQQIIDIDAPINIKTNLSGEVTLKFMAGGVSTLDTTVVLE